VRLGRGAGISDGKLAHILDETLPEGLFPDDEAAIVMFTRESTRMEPIDDETFNELKRHFTTRQIMEIIYTVGLNQMITRMHAAIQTEVDESTLGLVAEKACPLPLPPMAVVGSS
jgi:alkylhydroperoxidase family enzyme